MKKCPTCGAKHVPESYNCDCGYVFPRDQNEAQKFELSEPPTPGPGHAPNFGAVGPSMIIAGIVVGLGAAFFFDTSVPSDYVADRVQNIGLLQQQLMLYLAGCVIFFSGIVMLATDKVIFALKP